MTCPPPIGPEGPNAHDDFYRILTIWLVCILLALLIGVQTDAFLQWLVEPIAEQGAAR